MATKKPERDPRVIPATKASAEATRHFEEDRKSRIANQQQILSADDMAGLYDPKRGLFTTAGGDFRPLTVDDLMAFKAAVHDIQRRHGLRKGNVPTHGAAGGILAKQVINLSSLDDRSRASQQIHTVMPVNNRGGVVQIVTNASSASNVSRHHVMVQFLEYDEVLADGGNSLEAARRMVNGKLKFDCDCGRHRYWFRFIATIGNFNFGRPEDGFPKIRNPNLRGIACKHVIRVMALINSGGTFNLFAKRMIETGRRTLSNRLSPVTVAEQQLFVDQVAKEAKASKRGTIIRTDEEKREQRATQPSYQRQKATRDAKASDRAAVRKANEKLRKAKPAKVNRPATNAQNQALIAAMKAQGISDTQIAAVLKAMG